MHVETTKSRARSQIGRGNRLIPQFFLLVASRPTIMDDFLARRLGASVISSAGLPLRGADKMHGHNSPRRRASHDKTPIMRTRRWRREEGLRKAGVATRQSGPPYEARFRHRAQKISQHRRGACRSKKVSLSRTIKRMLPRPHKTCPWPTWVVPIGQIMGDKPEGR